MEFPVHGPGGCLSGWQFNINILGPSMNQKYRDALKGGQQVVRNWVDKVVVFCLPSAGSKTQLFKLIFTQPGAHL